ncbi:hypothetical protein K435DRAFT_767910 [Dendrothele bispora CBS 962.96]|uniref:Uncharacterized protein n=1 Tax=Dendrothele bispora (strain CBS 962.96) TaxID=1314807 RepID=A0A4S8KX79_DENBC|nr:hypothetical protein K435DRAFT_767910 [Dendrothele bispora CBS 962.96]
MLDTYLSVQIAASMLASSGYGIFAVLWGMSITLMINHLKKSTFHFPQQVSYSSILWMALKRPMILGTTALFICSTGHWIVIFIRVLQAFGYIPNVNWPAMFLADLKETTMVVYTAFLALTLLIGDCIVLYRLWCIWNHNRLVIIFPCLTTTGLLACICGTAYQFSQSHAGENILEISSGRWILSDAVLLFRTNCDLLAFIAWRVSQVHKSVSHIKKVFIIFIESAALILFWALAFIISYAVNSTMFIFVVDIAPSISGIACCMINIRIGLGYSQGSTTKASTLPLHAPAPPGSFRAAPVSPLEIAMDTVQNNESNRSVTSIKSGTRAIED